MENSTLVALQDNFRDAAVTTLSAFASTEGQCVGVSASISLILQDRNIPHKIALGSLSCNGVKAFQYRKAIPKSSNGIMDWDGHAWIEFVEGYIGEASLFRTAKAALCNSNMRQHLKSCGLLTKGAIFFDLESRRNFRLKYVRKSYLDLGMAPRFSDGLMQINA